MAPTITGRVSKSRNASPGPSFQRTLSLVFTSSSRSFSSSSLLFSTFQSVGDALLIMLNLPFAIIGGTLALYLWGTNFSISAAVGYIAVFGVSVLDGVVLVSFIRQAISEDLGIREAIVRGCEMRFRPIIVTAIVAIIGFLPAALSHGIGAEI